MADLDDIDRRLSTANWINGANLAANIATAANTSRIAEAAEEQNARARAAEEKEARIQGLRNILFEAETALKRIHSDYLATQGDSCTRELELYVRTLEIKGHLTDDGALKNAAYDAIGDKRYAEAIRGRIDSLISLAKDRFPEVAEELQTWNSISTFAVMLQLYLAYERLLAKPLKPDLEEKARITKKVAKWGAGSVILFLLFGWKIGLTAVVAYSILLVIMLKRTAPLCHAQRSEIGIGWLVNLPEGPLTHEKIQVERDELAALLIQNGCELADVERNLVECNKSRSGVADNAPFYWRKGSKVITQYNGPLLIPDF